MFGFWVLVALLLTGITYARATQDKAIDAAISKNFSQIRFWSVVKCALSLILTLTQSLTDYVTNLLTHWLTD